MRLPKVIAICGYKRSGKDTAADYLCEKYGFVKLKIADPLKQVCKTMFNFTDAQVNDDDKDKLDPYWGITPRQAMQYIGTELVQFNMDKLIPGIGRTFWIKQTIDNILKASINEDQPSRYVISDLRFKHELDELRKQFGTSDVFVMKITSNRVQECDTHSSECEWKKLESNVCLKNDTDIRAFYAQITEAMKPLN